MGEMKRQSLPQHCEMVQLYEGLRTSLKDRNFIYRS